MKLVALVMNYILTTSVGPSVRRVAPSSLVVEDDTRQVTHVEQQSFPPTLLRLYSVVSYTPDCHGYRVVMGCSCNCVYVCVFLSALQKKNDLS